jgi:hypothetical protein
MGDVEQVDLMQAGDLAGPKLVEEPRDATAVGRPFADQQHPAHR